MARRAIRELAESEARWPIAEACNAYITSVLRTARHSAETLADLDGRSPIGGMTFALKDNFATMGVRTTAGSRILKDYVPTYNSTIFNQLTDASALMVGKANMDEFGMGSLGIHSHFGPVLNPCDSKRSAGGSSSGSAAAVASGSCNFSIGSDTGGSVRLPASYCGVVGFKPSYGALSRWGLVAYASSLDCPGIMARSVADVEAVFDVLAQPDPNDQRTQQFYRQHPRARQQVETRSVKIGIPTQFFTEELSEETLAFWQRTISALSSQPGIVSDIIPVELPHTKHALAAYYVLALAEASSNLARYDGLKFGHRSSAEREAVLASRSEGFGAEVQRRMIMGTFSLSEKHYDSYFLQATHSRSLVSADFETVFNNVDMLLCPTASGPAPLLSEATQSVDSFLTDVFTVPASLAGLPAISVPVASSSHLPVGIQLIGPAGSDRLVLSMAGHLANVS